MWRGKVLAQVGLSLMYANYVLLFFYFNDMYEYRIGIVNLHWLKCITKYDLA